MVAPRGVLGLDWGLIIGIEFFLAILQSREKLLMSRAPFNFNETCYVKQRG